MTTPSQNDWNGHVPSSSNGHGPEVAEPDPTRSVDYQLGYLAGQFETLARFEQITLTALAQLAERCHRPRREIAPREAA